MPVVRAPTPQCPTGAYGHARSPRSAAEREWVQVCPHLPGGVLTRFALSAARGAASARNLDLLTLPQVAPAQG